MADEYIGAPWESWDCDMKRFGSESPVGCQRKEMCVYHEVPIWHHFSSELSRLCPYQGTGIFLPWGLFLLTFSGVSLSLSFNP